MDIGVNLLLAALEPGRPGVPQVSPASRLSLSGALPVLVVTLTLVLGFLAWALLIRRSRRPLRERGRLIDGEDRSTVGTSGRRRKRRRRERNRPRNPTLAETGGLPPPRAPDAQPPVP